MNSLAAPLYVVTGVLVIAGFVKLVRPAATATALRAISVPRPIIATRLLGAFEVVIGLIAVAIGHPIAWAGVAITYAGFVGFILWALQAEANVGSCGCFGRDDTPPTAGHAAFNAAAATMATIAIFDSVELSEFSGSTIEAVLLLVLIVVGTGLVVLALTALPRTLSIANGTATPAIAAFSIEPTLPLRSRAGRATKEASRRGDQKIQRGVSGEERAGNENSGTDGLHLSTPLLSAEDNS